MDAMEYQHIQEETPSNTATTVTDNNDEELGESIPEGDEPLDKQVWAEGVETQVQSKPSTNDNGTEPRKIGDGVSPNLEPSATTSKSRSIDAKKAQRHYNMKEFIKILRPILPRKSKSRANEMLKRFAKGFIVVNPMEVRIPLIRRRLKIRKARLFTKKKRTTRSLNVRRSVVNSSSMESCVSDSCPKCGHDCCRRYN